MEKTDVYMVVMNDQSVERVRCKESELKALKDYKRIKDYTLLGCYSIEALQQLTWVINTVAPGKEESK